MGCWEELGTALRRQKEIGELLGPGCQANVQSGGAALVLVNIDHCLKALVIFAFGPLELCCLMQA